VLGTVGQGGAHFVAEFLVGHWLSLGRSIPPRAPTLWADARLILDAAARYPFMCATLAPEPKNSNWHQRHRSISC
jgi:hypothetical protein